MTTRGRADMQRQRAFDRTPFPTALRGLWPWLPAAKLFAIGESVTALQALLERCDRTGAFAGYRHKVHRDKMCKEVGNNQVSRGMPCFRETVSTLELVSQPGLRVTGGFCEGIGIGYRKTKFTTPGHSEERCFRQPLGISVCLPGGVGLVL
ncbi:hypothetical protein EYF80_029246 [Liparis tanakae]|uniref:Uncharacterized protein n=1 Tax=Liparis tanakae TaxID=230148 RepID=A0A4Z2H692_9TELE|nr:hypothetical protein EYF80_029246 [Liparis tanakae]